MIPSLGPVQLAALAAVLPVPFGVGGGEPAVVLLGDLYELPGVMRLGGGEHASAFPCGDGRRGPGPIRGFHASPGRGGPSAVLSWGLMPRPDGEPTNFELIEQALLRLDPVTRHEVIQAMLVVAGYRGDRAWLLRQVLAQRPVPMPSALIISSGI